ncbi:FAD-binding protein, partial [Klebsiella pneumoniae]|nr:FAD-binding protein [Klebsiella pneumoniae]
GYTLALDLPASAQNLALLAELDDIVRTAGGRLYLAKDARQTRATFEAGYGDAADRFRSLRRETGAAHKIVSAQSRRLGL